MNGIVPDCSIVMQGSYWESQIFFRAGLVHFGGKPCCFIWAGSVHWSILAGSYVVLLGGFGPFWRVQSYVTHCTSEFNRHNDNGLQTTDNIKILVCRGQDVWYVSRRQEKSLEKPYVDIIPGH